MFTMNTLVKFVFRDGAVVNKLSLNIYLVYSWCRPLNFREKVGENPIRRSLKHTTSGIMLTVKKNITRANLWFEPWEAHPGTAKGCDSAQQVTLDANEDTISLLHTSHIADRVSQLLCLGYYTPADVWWPPRPPGWLSLSAGPPQSGVAPAQTPWTDRPVWGYRVTAYNILSCWTDSPIDDIDDYEVSWNGV